VADSKISDLPAVTDVVSGDKYVLARSGATKNIDADDLAAGIAALYPPTAAADVSIADAGNYYTSTDVEGALQEIGAGGAGSGIVAVFDSTLTGTAANFDVTSISGSYSMLQWSLTGRGTTAANDVEVRMRMNNDSGTNYEYQRLFAHSGSTVAGGAGTSQTSLFVGELAASSATSGRAGMSQGHIHDYAGTTFNKVVLAQSGRVASLHVVDSIAGSWFSTSAVTRLTFFPSAGSFDVGTRLTVWGIA